MTARLPEHLDLIATAPDGIQKLRGLILELAVRGKLVPQDPNDEPANELLKRMAQERGQLEGEGTCKKSKPVLPVGEDEQPFALPEGWQWVRLSEIGHDWGQKTPDETFTYIDVSAIDNARGTIVSPNVVAPDDAPSRARKLVRRGTVIYSTVRPYLLNIAVIDRDLSPPPIASTAFAIMHPLCGLSSHFVFWYLRSPVFVRYVQSVQTGIAYPAVNDAQFFSGLFPLPPLAEQHRIVAKVDELMVLCDRLEAEQTVAGAVHARLVATLLGTLTQSTGAAELATNWQHLAEHFDTLFTTDSSLDALRQTILQLAVMGKLVPQDPNDEPASELLKRIAKERARLEVGGTCKKSKATPVVGEAEQPYSLPDGWEWARLGLAMELISGQHLTPDEYTEGLSDPIPYLTGPAEFGETYPNPTRSTKQTRAIAISGDILLTVKGSGVGKLNRVSQSKLAISRQLMAVRTIAVCSNFLELVLRSAEQHFQDQTVGIAIPGIGRDDVQGLILGFPPLAEQHRIVAKVDELLALCDRLKASLAESRTQQERLAATLIESALQAA